MGDRFKQQDLTTRMKNNRFALWIEVLATLVLAFVVVFISLSNLEGQAESYVSSVEMDYSLLEQEYIRVFNTAYVQCVDKIEEDLTAEEMQAWLQSMDSKWKESMGSDIYDGIAFTYKGEYVRSWSYGDYSQYDATTRRWYQMAAQADGKTVVIPPYVTYLDGQFYNDDSYILMSVVKKYNNEIYFDYDIKLAGIRQIMENRDSKYRNTRMFLFDEDGYILSCNGNEYAHNLNMPDDVVSENLSQLLMGSKDDLERLRLVRLDHAFNFLYMRRDTNNNYIAVIVPFWAVFLRDLLTISFITLFLIVLELYLYERNRMSLSEYKNRDVRLSAVTDAVFQGRLFVDLESKIFYGNKEAAALCTDGSYETLVKVFSKRIELEKDRLMFTEFVSLEALVREKERPYRLTKQRFPMKWKMPNGKYEMRTIEVSRLLSVIDRRDTASILCRDVSEDAMILKEALKQAESASKAKGDFMSRMSHEIRTPLNAIIGYLDIAQSDRQDPDKVSHCLEQSRVASRHLLNIINDVLDISSIESGRMKIAHDDFDLTQLINSLTTIFYAQAKEKNVSFEVSVNELTTEWMNGDSLRLNQILLNLLSNAVKFTPAGGSVRLDIRQISVQSGRVHMQFVVSDTGIGMSEEYRERMFKPFEQESTDTAKEFGGTGLGLSICYNLVKMMGGTILVDSKLHGGTKFTVTLSFDEAKTKAEEHAVTPTFKSLRALVVDDEADTCEYVKQLLGRCGVESDVVTSGKKAIRRIRSRMDVGEPYDFCIVDWNMPEMDGLATSKSIREECGSEIPIIIATAYDYSAIIDEARTVGVDKIISKPLFQSTIFDMLVNTFGKYEPGEAKPAEQNKQVDFHGLHVIIAEDNVMNMEIATDILGKAGMVITPAVNGKIAYDLFVSSKPDTYDAILMDIQMPVMDGYEATKAIRKSEHPQAKSIPIVAMTANAFTSDVTAALAAGMNDHISKPIAYDKLYASLSRLTAKGDDK